MVKVERDICRDRCIQIRIKEKQALLEDGLDEST